jgi:hypothetical protein
MPMHDRVVGLAAAVSHDTGVAVREILLLRHAPLTIRALLKRGGTVQEYTALQPTDTRYDFRHRERSADRLLVVVVDDRVYEVYEVTGVAAEGTTYSLASPEHRATDVADNKPERPAKLFELAPVASRVVGQPVRGWAGRERTTVQRAGERFFGEIEVVIPAGIAPADVIDDLDAIYLGGDVLETTRSVIAQARVGQGRFRRDLMVLWKDRCAVTGCDVPEALRASHCKPWRDSTHAERLDPTNGLLLSASLDALFDAGIIAFSDSGRMLVHPSLTLLRQRALGITPAPLRGSLVPRQREFLQYHRERVFRGSVDALARDQPSSDHSG